MIRCFIYKKLSLAFLFTILSLSGNPFYGQINEKYRISNEVWQSYKLKNAKETRLLEFKDNDEQLLAKLVLLNLINKHRKKHHKQLVELDIHACRSWPRILEKLDTLCHPYLSYHSTKNKSVHGLLH